MPEDTQSASRAQVASAYARYNEAALGFRSYWYPVMFSRDLGKKPVPLTLLGDKVALFRSGGRAYALHNRCPHRGIPLSEGRSEAEGTITCVYHGWTYDLATGQLVAVLTDGPDSPICGKANVRTYPVEERAGLVWVYTGEGTPPPVEDDMPPQLREAGIVVEGVIERRSGNWRYAAENGIDEGHAKYLHRRSLWTLFRELPAWSQGVKMVPSDDGAWLMRRADGVRFSDTYPRVGRWPAPPRPWQKRARGAIQVGIRLPCWLLVEQRGWTGYEAYVPWDEQHYLSILLAVKRATGLQARLFRLRYRAWLRWVYHGQFNGQDQWMIDLMQIPPERLYRPDVSITAWRKLCHEQARGADVQPVIHTDRVGPAAGLARSGPTAR